MSCDSKKSLWRALFCFVRRQWAKLEWGKGTNNTTLISSISSRIVCGLLELQLTDKYLISFLQTKTLYTRLLLFQSSFSCWQNGGKLAVPSVKIIPALQKQPQVLVLLVWSSKCHMYLLLTNPISELLRTSAISLKNREKVQFNF